jgi:hypothetical protein
MILEVADIRIPPARTPSSRPPSARASRPSSRRARRATSPTRLQRGIESPERYLLMIWWQTLENHTVDFRQGPLFAEWRGFIGPFLAVPPHVEHFELAFESAWPR